MSNAAFDHLLAALRDKTRINLARLKVMTAIIQGLIMTQSVTLKRLAPFVRGEIEPKSQEHRVQMFFKTFRPDYQEIAKLILSFLASRVSVKYRLALDRTTWEFHDKPINLLVLSVCLGDTAVPVLWTELPKNGNSNTEARIELLSRFLAIVPASQIEWLQGDREFIGGDWFAWLKEQGIPFVMRFRQSAIITLPNGRTANAQEMFRSLAVGKIRRLPCARVFDQDLGIVVKRLESGELLLLAANSVAVEEADELYRYRWNIETGFQQLKSRGFDFEATHLSGAGKHSLLLAMLALAQAWAYSCGAWHVENVEPLRVEKKDSATKRASFHAV
jgi:hypothetical protein